LKIQKEQFKNAQFNLNRVTKEVEIGSKPKSDLYDIQLSFAQEELRIMATEQLLLQQKTQLFQLMNVNDVAVAEVMLENDMSADNNTANQSISNPKIKFAELNYQSIRKDTRLERANNLPTLTTYYGFSTFYYKPLNQPSVVVDDFNKQIGDNKNHQLGIQLNVPIFNGFRNNKRISAAQLETEKSKYVIEQEKLKVQNQIDLENQNKKNYLSLHAKLEETKTYAEASFRTSQAKFSSGVIDAIVFSSVKNQWLNAEYDLLKNQLQQQYVALKINLLNGNTF
jgi:outer membrane protein